jgi:hypothetical protein
MSEFPAGHDVGGIAFRAGRGLLSKKQLPLIWVTKVVLSDFWRGIASYNSIGSSDYSK